MGPRSRFTLVLGAWAILLGSGALIASFVFGFRASIEEERLTSRRLILQDSLLISVYHGAWECYDLGQQAVLNPEEIPALRGRFDVSVRSLEGSRNALRATIDENTDVAEAEGDFHSTVDSVLSDLRRLFSRTGAAPSGGTRVAKLFVEDLTTHVLGLRARMEELHRLMITDNIQRMARVDTLVESRYFLWAWVSFALVVGGLVFTLLLTRRERRQLEEARQLASGQRQFRNLVETSLEGVVITAEGRVEYANPAALKLFGYQRLEDLRAANFIDMLGSAGTTYLAADLAGKGSGALLLRDHEVRALTAQGRILDLEANAQTVEWEGALCVCAWFRDITERKNLEREQAVWLWEQETLSQIDRRLVGVVDLDRILDAILVQTLNLVKAPWAGVMMREDQPSYVRWHAIRGGRGGEFDVPFELTPALRAILSSAEPITVHGTSGSGTLNTESVPGLAQEGLVSTVWIPLKDEGGVRGAVAVGYRRFHELSDREMRMLNSLAEKMSIAMANARLYQNLVEHERELEFLSGARVDAQEEERRRIAREIHDGLGQMLTAIKLNLEILQDTTSMGDDEHRRISDVINLLDSTMREAREISYNLMPSVLEDFGLAPALQMLCERFMAGTEMSVAFQAHGMNRRLRPAVEVALYRIVQEALNNSSRHGVATEVNVQVVRGDEVVRLTVEDNGRGMVPGLSRARRMAGGGVGLASMRERVNSFKGTLSIDSAPGKGTVITVEVPLEKEQIHVEDQDPAGR